MRLFFNIILFLFLFSSCQKDDSSGKEQQKGLFVPVSLTFALSEPAQAGDVSSGTVSTKSTKTAPFSVSYIPVAVVKTKAPTTFSNVWVLQFSSNTCVKATNLGTVSTTNINPTLISGSGYTIYIIANGPSSSTAFTSITKPYLESTLAYSESISGDAPYIGKLDGVTISTEGVLNSGSSQAPTLTLTRIAAKVSLTLNYSVPGYTLQSVEMYNAPKNMYYVNGNSASIFPVTPSSTDINQSSRAANVVPSTPTNGTYTWYVGENKRGTNAAITSPYNKDFLHAPTADNGYYYCTYIRIKAKRNDGLGEINYYIYPGGNNITDFNVIRNYDYNLNVMMQGNAASQESMDGVDGRVRITSSNCYMVTPGSTITIPVNIKGNANKPLTEVPTDNTIIGGVTHSAVSVAVLWQTSSGLISNISNVYNGKVNISTSATPGNAVVAAYSGANGTGTILWSWHMWVTNYKPDIPENGTTRYFSNENGTYYRIMDRNLGATSANIATSSDVTSFGLLYQWGRKDPFPGANSISTPNASCNSVSIYGADGIQLTELIGNNGTGVKHENAVMSGLITSVQHPLTIYYNANANNDWYSTDTSKRNDELWGGNSDKTVYDPCPRGWRVPSWVNGHSPWGAFNGLGTNYGTWNNGWNLTATGYYPPAGCRSYDTATLYYVGNESFLWTASPINLAAHSFWLNTTDLNPNWANIRVHSFSVRCVQE